jgi:hypothetical protein
MKKFMFGLLMLSIFIVTSAFAAGPYLVCDPYSSDVQIATFLIQFDNGTWIESTPHTFNGETILHYDLQEVSNGNHTVVAKMVDIWGNESAPSDPFVFQKGNPAAPNGLKLSIE